MITVRQATLEDKDAIFQFIQEAYKDRWQYKIPERWQWEFIDNPYLEGKGLPVFIAIDEAGKVVGQTCTLVEPLKLGDQICRVGWSVDTFLLPQYRGQGIGFRLQKANDEANEIFMSLNMSLANRRIKAGLGSVPVDPVVLYTRLVRYEPESIRQAAAERLAKEAGLARRLVDRLLRWTLLDRLVSAVLNGWVALRDRRLLGKVDSSLVIEPVKAFGAEIDRLWERISSHYPALVVRDQKYLNWKYTRQPFMNYSLFLARRGEELCAYLILRLGKPPERYVGVIADLFAAPQDEAAILACMRFAVRCFQKARVKDVLAASTIPVYQKCLEALGFKWVKEAFPMFHSDEADTRVAVALEPGSWFLSKGDHDWDQYPLTR